MALSARDTARYLANPMRNVSTASVFPFRVDAQELCDEGLNSNAALQDAVFDRNLVRDRLSCRKVGKP